MKTHNCLRDAVCLFLDKAQQRTISGKHKQMCSLLLQEFNFSCFTSIRRVKNMFLIWFDGVETNVNHVNLHNQCQGLIEAD